MIYNDSNGHEFGGVPVTVGALTYFANDISTTDASKRIEIQGEDDEVEGQIFTDEVPTLTANFQLMGQALPAKYGTFTYLEDTWIISSRGKTRGIGAIAMCPIVAHKRLITP
jgi:hypothetical protein